MINHIKITYLNQINKTVGTQVLDIHANQLSKQMLNLPAGYQYANKHDFQQKLVHNTAIVHLLGNSVHYQVALPLIRYADGHEITQSITRIPISGHIGDIVDIPTIKLPSVAGYKLHLPSHKIQVQLQVSQYQFVSGQPTLKYFAKQVSNLTLEFHNQNNKLINTTKVKSTLDRPVDLNQVHIPDGYSVASKRLPKIKMTLTPQTKVINLIGNMVRYKVPLQLRLINRQKTRIRPYHIMIHGHVGDIATINSSRYPVLSGYNILHSPLLKAQLTRKSYLPIADSAWSHKVITLKYQAQSKIATVNFFNQHHDKVDTVYLHGMTDEYIDLSSSNNNIVDQIPVGYRYSSSKQSKAQITADNNTFDINVIGREVNYSVSTSMAFFTRNPAKPQHVSSTNIRVHGRVGDKISISPKQFPAVNGYSLRTKKSKSLLLHAQAYTWVDTPLVLNYQAKPAKPISIRYINQIGSVVRTIEMKGLVGEYVNNKTIGKYLPYGYHFLKGSNNRSYTFGLKPHIITSYLSGIHVKHVATLVQKTKNKKYHIKYPISGNVGSIITLMASQFDSPEGYHLLRNHEVKIQLGVKKDKYLTKPVLEYTPYSASALIYYKSDNGHTISTHRIVGHVDDKIDVAQTSKFQSEYLPTGYVYDEQHNKDLHTITLAPDDRKYVIHVVGKPVSRHVPVTIELMHNDNVQSVADIDVTVSGRIGHTIVWNSKKLHTPKGYHPEYTNTYKLSIDTDYAAWKKGKPIIRYQADKRKNIHVNYVNQHNHVLSTYVATGYTNELLDLSSQSRFNMAHLPDGYHYNSHHAQTRDVKVTNNSQTINVYVTGDSVSYKAVVTSVEYNNKHGFKKPLQIMLSGHVGDTSVVHPQNLIVPTGYELLDVAPVYAVLTNDGYVWQLPNNSQPLFHYKKQGNHDIIVNFINKYHHILARHIIDDPVHEQINISRSSIFCRKYIPQGYHLKESKKLPSIITVTNHRKTINLPIQGNSTSVDIKIVQLLLSPSRQLLATQESHAKLSGSVGDIKSINAKSLPVPSGYRLLSDKSPKFIYTRHSYHWISNNGEVEYEANTQNNIVLKYKNQNNQIVTSNTINSYTDKDINLSRFGNLNQKYLPSHYHLYNNNQKFFTVSTDPQTITLNVQGSWVKYIAPIKFIKQNANGSGFNGRGSQDIVLTGQVGSTISLDIQQIKPLSGYTLILSHVPKVQLFANGFHWIGHAPVLTYRANPARITVNYLDQNGHDVLDSIAEGYVDDVLDLSESGHFNSQHLPVGYSFDQNATQIDHARFDINNPSVSVYVSGQKVSRKIGIKLLKISHNLKTINQTIPNQISVHGQVGDHIEINAKQLPHINGYHIISTPNAEIELTEDSYKIINGSPFAKYQALSGARAIIQYINSSNKQISSHIIHGAVDDKIDLSKNSDINKKYLPEGYRYSHISSIHHIFRLSTHPQTYQVFVKGIVSEYIVPVTARFTNGHTHMATMRIKGAVGSIKTIDRKNIPYINGYKIKHVPHMQIKLYPRNFKWINKQPIIDYSPKSAEKSQLQFVDRHGIVSTAPVHGTTGQEIPLDSNSLIIEDNMPDGYDYDMTADNPKMLIVSADPQITTIRVSGELRHIKTSLNLVLLSKNRHISNHINRQIIVSGHVGDTVTVNPPKLVGYTLLKKPKLRCQITPGSVNWVDHVIPSIQYVPLSNNVVFLKFVTPDETEVGEKKLTVPTNSQINLSPANLYDHDLIPKGYEYADETDLNNGMQQPDYAIGSVNKTSKIIYVVPKPSTSKASTFTRPMPDISESPSSYTPEHVQESSNNYQSVTSISNSSSSAPYYEPSEEQPSATSSSSSVSSSSNYQSASSNYVPHFSSSSSSSSTGTFNYAKHRSQSSHGLYVDVTPNHMEFNFDSGSEPEPNSEQTNTQKAESSENVVNSLAANTNSNGSISASTVTFNSSKSAQSSASVSSPSTHAQLHQSTHHAPKYPYIKLTKPLMLYRDRYLRISWRLFKPIESLTIPVIYTTDKYIAFGKGNKVIGYLPNKPDAYISAFYSTVDWQKSSGKIEVINPNGTNIYTMIQNRLNIVRSIGKGTVLNVSSFDRLNASVTTFVISPTMFITANRNFVKLI